MREPLVPSESPTKISCSCDERLAIETRAQDHHAALLARRRVASRGNQVAWLVEGEIDQAIGRELRMQRDVLQPGIAVLHFHCRQAGHGCGLQR